MTHVRTKRPMVAWLIAMVVAIFTVVSISSIASAAVTPERYVDGEKVWVDYGDYAHGASNAPFLTIQEAIDDLKDSGFSQGTIYVAEGDYSSEDLTMNYFDNLVILGGYENTFSTQDTLNNKSRVKSITAVSVGGEVAGLTFQGLPTMDKVMYFNNTGQAKDILIRDNYFFFSQVNDFFVKVDGSPGATATIKDNFFDWAFTGGSLIESGAAGETVIENNFIYSSKATNSNIGMIQAENGAIVKNNLIVASQDGNTVVIGISGEAYVYNNTLSDNEASVGAIASSGAGHEVKNNLVYKTIGGKGFFLSSADDEGNASIDESTLSTGIESAAIDRCEPDFSSTRDKDPNDYKLGAASNCDEKGVTVTQASPDYFGNARPAGGSYDIGFHEYPNLTIIIDPIIVDPIDPDPVDPDPVDPDPMVVDCGLWHDIDSTDSHYDIALYLCEHGEIVRGDSFGNLRIDDNLTRAELLAIAFRAREYKNFGVVDVNAEACFVDVIDDWYAKYFCTAKDEGFVQGYPGGEARPGNTVLLAESLKMLLGALDKSYTIDTGDCWYCSMLWTAQSANYLPYTFNSPTDIGGDELTRRHAMDMAYRILIDS